ncbi:MAG: DNA mismatch repair endonuclease MutL, partial [Elusimicrobia bacterium]|nr:DNA mismatch repair endonuclease MutL [Elusimicrobiota bacterium]
EDLLLSVKRHSTSKILNFEDLETLKSFGFRGEALYSIFAVSRLSIITSKENSEFGISINGQGGKIISEGQTPPVKGTIIEVRDLFFNMPAREKFLKSDQSERSHLVRTMEEAALANLDISFTLKIDDIEIFSFHVALGDSANRLLERSALVLGKNLSKGLMGMENKNGEILLKGLISKPDGFSASRQNQYFFVNKRPVSSKVLHQALYRAYSGLTGHKHPSCVLFIDMPAADFDVNIHPQKKDVKFKDDGDIFKIISHSVLAKLQKLETPASFTENNTDNLNLNHNGVNTIAEPTATTSFKDEEFKQGGLFFKSSDSEDTAGVNSWYQAPIIYLGQIACSYLVFESGRGLLLIDQHAAQERILFEKYLDEFSSDKIKIQPLLTPVTVELSRSQIENAMRWKEWLDKAGFEIDLFGANTVRLHSTPSIFYFTPEALSEFLSYLAEVLGNPEKSTEDLKRNTVATLACKKSIKARDKIKPEEAIRLIEDLKKAKDSLHCPHGRPTFLHFSAHDIARHFGRTGAL